MEKLFNIIEILQATNGLLLRNGRFEEISGISTDSRTIQSGQAFIALKGENNDGHMFLKDAVDRGAYALIISSQDTLPVNIELPYVIKVSDTTKALGDLAHFHRERFSIPVIGITGSYGKTTTKEIVSWILEGGYNVVKSKKSFNNFIGVPLTLLEMNEKHNVAVIEMGTNAPGEIKRLCSIASPNMGILTAVDECHLEGFGDLYGVAKEKNELLLSLGNKGTAFVCRDNDWCRRLASQFPGKCITYGLTDGVTVKASICNTNEKEIAFLLDGNRKVDLKIPGRHNVVNMLAGIAVAREFGMSEDQIISRVESFKLPPMRLSVEELEGVTLINDAYNANPGAMLAALEELERLGQGKRKVAVLGSMLELGKDSERLHRKVGSAVHSATVDKLCVVGMEAFPLAMEAIGKGLSEDKVELLKTTEEACRVIPSEIRQGDVVLIKGSRMMGLEKVVESIREGIRR